MTTARHSQLPQTIAPHSSDHSGLADFAGRNVLMVGDGQSAIGSAALRKQRGAQIEVLHYGPRITWLRGEHPGRSAAPTRRILHSPTDGGWPGTSWIVALTGLFRRLPRRTRDAGAYRLIRPAAAWFVERLRGVRMTTGRHVISAAQGGGQTCLFFEDATESRIDNVLLATGCRVDAFRYRFLTDDILRSVRLFGGYPELAAGFESSVPGLHFLGAAGAYSVGPILRFVSGDGYAARAVTRFVSAWAEKDGLLPRAP